MQPQFIGIGFQRCATSWAKSCLSEHPQIALRKDSIHYFSEHRSRGAQWYFEQFEPLGRREVLIDLSVSYGYPEHVAASAREIANTLPTAQLFAFVRHPVERAFSDYQRSVFRGELAHSVSPEQALTQRPEYLARGRYASLLGKVLEYVDPARLRIFFFEDVMNRPTETWTELCKYFRVEDSFQPSFLTEQTNHAAVTRYPAVTSTLRAAYRSALAMPAIGHLLRTLRARPVWQSLMRSLMTQPSPLSPETAHRLRQEFEPDIAFLEQHTGRDLSSWRHL